MAGQYFYLNWIFSGFLFIPIAGSPLNCCEIQSISLDESAIPIVIAQLRNQQISKCFRFTFGNDNEFIDDVQGLIFLSIKLNGNESAKICTKISFVKKKQLGSIDRLSELNAQNTTAIVNEEFLFDVKYGVC